MTVISKDVANQMAKALTVHKLNNKAQRLFHESDQLIADIYSYAVPPDKLAALAEVDRLFPGKLVALDNVYLDDLGRLDVRHHVGVWQGKSGYYTIFEHAPTTSCLWFRYAQFETSCEDNPLPEDLANRVRDFQTAWSAFISEVTETFNKARAAVMVFRTYKKLETEWVDALPVIGEFIPDKSAQLPAVMVPDLNAAFDLPPETKHNK